MSILLDLISNFNFENLFLQYDKAIHLRADSKTKKIDGQNLIRLDGWIQKEFAATILSREEPHLTLNEITDLMRWKLLGGKFRPRLLQLVETNDPKVVQKQTKQAISLVKKNEIKAAVEKLCALKGVGPATASAVLSVCAPEKCGFFADEVAQFFIKNALKYNVKEYLIVNEQLSLISEKLNKEHRSSTWTPHKVELALWTQAILKHRLEDSSKASSRPTKKLKEN